jgi:REP element-mobilizing transposase RayT
MGRDRVIYYGHFRVIGNLPTEMTMTLYKNKYRIESARHPNWDYSANGWYFITICTQNRQYFFGNIQNGIMDLSIAGKIAQKLWGDIPDRFPHVQLNAFIVMPNHIHGILIIDRLPDDGRDAINRVSTANHWKTDSFHPNNDRSSRSSTP